MQHKRITTDLLKNYQIIQFLKFIETKPKANYPKVL